MIVLASSSPRRKKLLRLLGIKFQVVPPSHEPPVPQFADPGEYVIYSAKFKAIDVSRKVKNAIVIGADTVVVINNRILGKPASKQEAIEYLTLLSGKEHTVYSGIAVIHNGNVHVDYDYAFVRFGHLSAKEINWYISTGEPMDKAGAYGIQGLGARFIESINGDYYSIIGLPLRKLYLILRKLNIIS